MPAPLSEARMREIARVVATSPTMDGAAVALGYANGRSLSVSIAVVPGLRDEVFKARKRAGRKSYRRTA